MTGHVLMVQSSLVLAVNKSVITEEGECFWVTEDDGNWVEATSVSVGIRLLPLKLWGKEIPMDAKLFPTEEEATAFAKRWQGHPWWVKPNGNFKVITVEPVFEQRKIAYREVTP
jgi:hypothetical protein